MLFFFFKQKTAYEMLISDWSSDVCSSDLLAHLDEGATAPVTLQHLLEEDPDRDHRQVGIVDMDGVAASHTGSACFDWAGGATGEGYAIQGNILTGPEVVEAMERAWCGSTSLPFAARLPAALPAGAAGGGCTRERTRLASGKGWSIRSKNGGC